MITGQMRPTAHHPHRMAKGLAALGRNGDSMLVHMSPREVAGLQKLALASGGSLSVNPETGLVEAGWLKSILPFVGGLALDAFAPEFAAENPFAISVGTGLIDKAMGGSWSEAFNAGLGMYGGLQAGQSLKKLDVPTKDVGTSLANAANDPNTSGAVKEAIAQSAVENKPPEALFNKLVPEDVTPTNYMSSVPENMSPVSGYMTPVATGGMSPVVNATANTMFDRAVPQAAQTGGGTMWGGLKNIVTNPSTDKFKQFYTGLGDSTMARSAALMGGVGAISNTIDAYNLSHMGLLPTAESQNEWYVAAPGQKSLWRQGRINPHVAQYGYLPQGESYYLDQGWNPGVYTKTPPTFKKGGLTSLKHFDAGGVTAVNNPANRPVITTDASVGNPTFPEVTNDPQVMTDMHQYYRNMLENSRGMPTQLNLNPPPPDAMNAYLNRVSQMIQPSAGGAGGGGGANGSGGWQWNNGSGSGAGGGNGLTTPGTGTVVRNPNTNLNTGSGVEKLPGSYYTGSGGGWGGWGNNWTPPTSQTPPTTDPADQLKDIKVTAQKQYPKVPLKDRLTNMGVNMGLNALLPGLGTARSLYQSWNSPSSNKLRHVLGIPDYSVGNIDPNGTDPAAEYRHIPVVDNLFELPAEQQWLDNTLKSDFGYSGFGLDAPVDVNPNMNYSYGLGTDPIENVSGNGVAYAAHGGQINHMARGGIADLVPTYAAGGRLLRGDGDGMSDSIPAVITGQKPQRAALADGEFVIPADVVSHLGNGSTEAGSRKLYQMMDKIRYARTGNKKQGKQINPNKFLPN